MRSHYRIQAVPKAEPSHPVLPAGGEAAGTDESNALGPKSKTAKYLPKTPQPTACALNADSDLSASTIEDESNALVHVNIPSSSGSSSVPAGCASRTAESNALGPKSKTAEEIHKTPLPPVCAPTADIDHSASTIVDESNALIPVNVPSSSGSTSVPAGCASRTAGSNALGRSPNLRKIFQRLDDKD